MLRRRRVSTSSGKKSVSHFRGNSGSRGLPPALRVSLAGRGILKNCSSNNPDPPTLVFFDFLAFFVFRFPLAFLGVFLSFPRILGVLRREKLLLFCGVSLAFSKKARVGGPGK